MVAKRRRNSSQVSGKHKSRHTKEIKILLYLAMENNWTIIMRCLYTYIYCAYNTSILILHRATNRLKHMHTTYLTTITPGIQKALKKFVALLCNHFILFLLFPVIVVIIRSSELMSGSLVGLINGVVSCSLSSESSEQVCKDVQVVAMYVYSLLYKTKHTSSTTLL